MSSEGDAADGVSLKSLMLLIKRNHIEDDKRFERYSSEVSNKIDTLTEKLDNVISVHNERITKVEGDIIAATNTCIELENRLFKSEQTIAQLINTNERHRYGVPIAEKEQLNIVYNKLCEAVKFAGDNSLSQIFRIGMPKAKSNKPIGPPVILLRFKNKHSCVSFFNSYITSRLQLKASDIGFMCETRIYINFNLTAADQIIYKKMSSTKSR